MKTCQVRKLIRRERCKVQKCLLELIWGLKLVVEMYHVYDH